MMEVAAQGPIALAATQVSDYVISPDGSKIYVAGRDGAVRVFDAQTGGLLSTWQVGVRLAGMDISPDGSFLIVIEQGIYAGNSGWGASNTIYTYKVSTATGAVTAFPFTATDYDATFADVVILADGTAILSQDFAGSGWTPLRALNTQTGAYGVPSGMEPWREYYQGSALTVSADRSKVLVSELNLSSANLYMYQPGLGQVADHGTYQDGVYGSAYGVQAMSPGSNLVAQFTDSQLRIYNGNLDLQLSLTAMYPYLHSVSAVAFDDTGANLFVVDANTDAVLQFSTSNWALVQSLAIGTNAWSSHTGSELVVGPGARYFVVLTEGYGLRVVNNPAAGFVIGTDQADSLGGTAHADTIEGRGGDDTLSGGGAVDTLRGEAGNDYLDGGDGADILEGGVGNDTYVVGEGDTVTEAAGAGTDTVRTALSSYQIGANVERLGGTSSTGQTLVGNALDNVISGVGGYDTLFGLDGNDRLDGGVGPDTLFGGAGDDVYLVDAGDTVVEEAGSGDDHVYTPIGSNSDFAAMYVLPSHVERFTGTSDLGQGVHGNAQNNRFDMGAGRDLVVLQDGGDDSVSGGGGDDFLYYGGALTPADLNDGGAGYDTLALMGSYQIRFDGSNFTSIEKLALYSSGGEGSNNYTVHMSDTALAAAAQLFVAAGSLTFRESLVFDGSEEMDGRFVVLGGAGQDKLTGGARPDHLMGGNGADLLVGLGGSDTLIGGGGGDHLTGGAGKDIFRFESREDSTVSAMDRISDFKANGDADRIDLSAIDAKFWTAGDDAFSFIGNNVAFSGTAGELRAVQVNGVWFVEADINGDADADLLIRVDAPASHIFSAADFIL